MPKLQRLLPAKWWSSFLWIAVSYIVFADILPNLLLLLINCSGYLPYSDRPGPGWQSPHLPSKEELNFFLGFAYSLIVPTAIYSAGFGVIGLLFGLCSLPRWLTRLIGSPLAFIASGFMMMAAGWMIAISAVGIYTAAICGLIWGLVVLPLLIVRRTQLLPMWLRVVLPIAVFSAAALYLLQPFLPKPAETETTVYVLEQTPLGKSLDQVDWSNFGGMPKMEHIPTERFAPVTISVFSMSDKRKSRVLVLLSDSESPDTTLDVPRTGDAIYSENHGSWTTLLKPSKKASFRIRVIRGGGVGADGNCCHSGSSTNWIFPPDPAVHDRK
jgi:hypothetical protein